MLPLPFVRGDWISMEINQRAKFPKINTLFTFFLRRLRMKRSLLLLLWCCYCIAYAEDFRGVGGLRAGAAEAQGDRPYMQDRVAIHCNNDVCCFGVFDGHGVYRNIFLWMENSSKWARKKKLAKVLTNGLTFLIIAILLLNIVPYMF